MNKRTACLFPTPIHAAHVEQLANGANGFQALQQGLFTIQDFAALPTIIHATHFEQLANGANGVVEVYNHVRTPILITPLARTLRNIIRRSAMQMPYTIGQLQRAKVAIFSRIPHELLNEILLFIIGEHVLPTVTSSFSWKPLLFLGDDIEAISARWGLGNGRGPGGPPPPPPAVA